MDIIRWDVLVATTSAGLCAACAYILHQRNSHLSAVSQATSFSSISRLIDYVDENELNEIGLVSVTGKVSAVGPPLDSAYLDNLKGVITEQQVLEHKSEWVSALQRWMDSESLISLASNHVPFTLTDGVNCLSVFSPGLSAQSPLQIVYDKFEPRDEASAMKHLVNHVLGSHVKGHQYLEKMLPVDTILTAIGSVKRDNDVLSVGPPSNGLPFLLSRQSLTEIMQDLKEKTFYPRVFMFFFCGVTVSALSYIGWKKWRAYQEQKKRDAIIREIETMRDSSSVPHESCVVCLDKPRGTVLIPCGHVCVCLLCADMLDMCPVCRTNIDRVVRTYNA